GATARYAIGRVRPCPAGCCSPKGWRTKSVARGSPRRIVAKRSRRSEEADIHVAMGTVAARAPESASRGEFRAHCATAHLNAENSRSAQRLGGLPCGQDLVVATVGDFRVERMGSAGRPGAGGLTVAATELH